MKARVYRDDDVTPRHRAMLQLPFDVPLWRYDLVVDGGCRTLTGLRTTWAGAMRAARRQHAENYDWSA